eukprot:TRINITY_DN4416_c0_g4_i4.p1 TRINITY_DN4416_c0_g4~~TRINITY_DN4416_c0_g4_i4.p1  ORF type:complete len:211 (+),score=46.01 TRINITY_DN4416_c0_g4_i4:33-635(+)
MGDKMIGRENNPDLIRPAPVADPAARLETLDEPVSETILRDLKMIGLKMSHVLLPRGSTKELRNWDLWGPLILCLLLATTLSLTAAEDQSALMFATVFVLVWCGAGVVTINAVLLGGNMSFFQSVCVLGYCICPLNIASIICRIWYQKIFQTIVVAVAFVWSNRASISFMAQLVPEDRKALGVYPVVLFYLVISWMILVQ